MANYRATTNSARRRTQLTGAFEILWDTKRTDSLVKDDTFTIVTQDENGAAEEIPGVTKSDIISSMLSHKGRALNAKLTADNKLVQKKMRKTEADSVMVLSHSLERLSEQLTSTGSIESKIQDIYDETFRPRNYTGDIHWYYDASFVMPDAVETKVYLGVRERGGYAYHLIPVSQDRRPITQEYKNIRDLETDLMSKLRLLFREIDIKSTKEVKRDAEIENSLKSVMNRLEASVVTRNIAAMQIVPVNATKSTGLRGAEVKMYGDPIELQLAHSNGSVIHAGICRRKSNNRAVLCYVTSDQSENRHLCKEFPDLRVASENLLSKIKDVILRIGIV